MENKNFEKREYINFFSDGYNTCLDRTNAKGIYEALKELVHLHLCEQEGIASGQPTRNQWLKAVEIASAELKKAE